MIILTGLIKKDVYNTEHSLRKGDIFCGVNLFPCYKDYVRLFSIEILESDEFDPLVMTEEEVQEKIDSIDYYKFEFISGMGEIFKSHATEEEPYTTMIEWLKIEQLKNRR